MGECRMRERGGGTECAVRVLAMAGPLSYLLMLLFLPFGLTAQASGERLLLDPRGQTVLSALVLALGCLAFGFLPRRQGGGVRALAGLAGVAAGLALIGGALAICVQAAWVPAAVAVLLCVAAALQFYGAAYAFAGIAVRDLFSHIAAALLVAVAVSAASCAFPVAAYGTCLVALVMAACAPCPYAALRLSGGGVAGADRTCEPGDAAGDAAAGAVGAQGGERRGLSQLRYDWQPLVGGCICALSLGLGWAQGAATEVGAAVAFATVGRVLAGGALLVFGLAHARGVVSAHGISALLFFAGALGVLTWIVGDLAGFGVAVVVIAGFTQAIFVGAMLAETVLTARDAGSPAALACTGLALFLGAFLVGLVGAGVLDGPAASAMVALSYLAFLCAVHVALLRRATRGADSADDDTPARAVAVRAPGFDDVCALMAQEYGLSPRESEVLPMLVAGLSSAAVGERLFVSTQTAKSHKHRIYVKLGVHSHDELASLFSARSAQAGARM